MTLTNSSWLGDSRCGSDIRIAAEPSVRLTAVRFCTGPSWRSPAMRQRSVSELSIAR